MGERATAKVIEDQALAWVARLDREASHAALEAELNAWLEGDSRRRGAFLRAQAAWMQLDRAGVLGVSEEREARVRPSRRLLVTGGAVAAAVGGVSVWGAARGVLDARIRTVRGEIRRVPLEDGSMLAVNTESQLKVALDRTMRRVDLERGETWFQVAKDTARPFVVVAGDVRVRAVGTAFSVRRHERGSDVLVTEGVVEVWSAHAPEHVRRLSVGDHAFVSEAKGAGMSQSAAAEIDRRLAWRDGEIVLDGDTLGDAVVEFNRYNTRQLRIEGPGLASEALVGRFRTNEPEAFARAVAVTAEARVLIDDEVIRISRL